MAKQSLSFRPTSLPLIRPSSLSPTARFPSIGDLVNGYNQTDAWMKQMEEYQATMSHLKMPWCLTVWFPNLAKRLECVSARALWARRIPDNAKR